MPFDKKLKKLNEIQLDFILEMYAEDHPDEFKFTKPGQLENVAESDMKASWSHVLKGKALMQYNTKLVPLNDALRETLKNIGKPIKPVIRTYPRKPPKR